MHLFIRLSLVPADWLRFLRLMDSPLSALCSLAVDDLQSLKQSPCLPKWTFLCLFSSCPSSYWASCLLFEGNAGSCYLHLSSFEEFLLIYNIEYENKKKQSIFLVLHFLFFSNFNLKLQIRNNKLNCSNHDPGFNRNPLVGMVCWHWDMEILENDWKI